MDTSRVEGTAGRRVGTFIKIPEELDVVRVREVVVLLLALDLLLLRSFLHP